MKNTILIGITVFFATVFFGSLQIAQAADQVVAYYFHGDFRCSNCLKIEKYSKEAIEKYFSEELKTGKLVYKVVNVDKEENAHFVKDYQLYTKSLVLSLIKGGKEVKFQNLTGVWENLGNRERFYEYVRNCVESYLKDLEK